LRRKPRGYDEREDTDGEIEGSGCVAQRVHGAEIESKQVYDAGVRFSLILFQKAPGLKPSCIRAVLSAA